MAINETDVKLFVDSWKQGVLDIKNVYDNKGDYQEQASKFCLLYTSDAADDL